MKKLVIPMSVGTALLVLGTPWTAAAATETKSKPSSDLPWMIGLIVVVVLALAVLLLKMRRSK